MVKQKALTSFKKTSAILQAVVIAIAALLPATLLSNTASGAQLNNRRIDMSATQTSEGSGRDGGDAFGQDVTYSVSFDIGTTGNIQVVVIDFCGDSPITGDTCIAPAGFNTNSGTLAIANQVGVSGNNFAVTTGAGNSTASRVVLTRTASSIAQGVTVSFDLGTTAAADGFTNPTSVGSFYARIITYASTANYTGYTSATPGTFVDDGGIALSVANELTITARVQEVLEFCIGTETASLAAINANGVAGYDPLDSCTQISGTDLSLDVVDSNSIATTSTIDVPNDGVAMLRTNAINGAVVYYKAEQDGSANGGKGALKINGSNCSVTLTDLNDPCFNSVGSTRAVITQGVEKFGMALKERITTTGGATNAVTCDAAYYGDGTAACTGAVVGDNYAWVDTGIFDTIASAAGPVDDELTALEFAATASPTTPTGLYTVTANFVATATF